MNCELSATLHAYCDGELDAVRAAEIEEHMKTCGECQNSLKTLQALRKGLQKRELYEPAAARIRSQIAEQLTGKSVKQSRPWRWYLVPAFSVAAAVIAVLVGSLLVQQRAESLKLQAELIDAHVRSLQPGHLMDVQSTDQHTVKPWFDGKLEFSPPVTDLSQQGFPLLGGRLDVVGGQDVAAIVYSRRKHLINLFVWPKTRNGSGINGAGSRLGYNWLTWSNGEMQFSLVSDTSVEDLHELKALLVR